MGDSSVARRKAVAPNEGSTATAVARLIGRLARAFTAQKRPTKSTSWPAIGYPSGASHQSVRSAAREALALGTASDKWTRARA